DLGAQHPLAVTWSELRQVQPRAVQLQSLAVERTRLLKRTETLAATNRRDQACYQRALGSAQPDDDVSQLPDRFPPLVRDRPPDQLGQVQHAPVSSLRRRGRL